MNFLLLYFLGILPFLPFEGKITPELKKELERIGNKDKVFAIVHLSTIYPYEEVDNLSYKEKAKIFKSIAENSQNKIIEFLKNNFKSDEYEILRKFWVFNGFHIKATKSVIYTLEKLNDIWFICGNEKIILDGIIKKEKRELREKTVEWNILRVRADSCWMAGYTGQGIIIGHIDTGVDTSHLALKNKWLSPYWFDGVYGQPSPYDNDGHGTHTMGTICGGDGLGPFQDDIGVAPDVKFVTAKGFSGGIGYYEWIDPCMQKIVDWKESGVDIRAVSNSWSGGRLDLHFWPIILTWKSMGIFPVFSNGNSGPNYGTANTPGNYPTVIGVGATDISDVIANFSSRGPAPDESPWNDPQYWYRPDWNLIKPDISAPGVYVRSSVPGGGYQAWSGTSMACPHVTGAVAILLQKNPNLTPNDLYTILVNSARQVEPCPNFDYGWGILNIYKALLNTPTPDEPFIYLLSFQRDDQNQNGIWEPGENSNITINLKNSGGRPAVNTYGVLKTQSPYVSIIDSISSFGDIYPGDSVNNPNDPYKIFAHYDAPWGSEVLFTLEINAQGYSSTKFFKTYIGIPGFDYVTHDTGNIVLSVTRHGSIGYMSSYPPMIYGRGCHYPKTSPSHLFYGSFAIGNSTSYVVDRYYNQEGDDQDWITLDPEGKVRLYEPGPFSDEYTIALYDDSGHPSSKNILVKQETFAWGDTSADDFVIYKFTIKNRGNTTVNNLYSAIFLDWDIGDYQQNVGGVDTIRNLAYMYYGSVVMGSAVIDPPRNSGKINHSLIDHAQYVYPYGGLPDNIQFQFMNGTIKVLFSDRPYDWSTCISAGPFNINSQDSIITAFAILGATSLTKLRKYCDTAYARYWNMVHLKEVSERNNKLTFFNVSPNIIKDNIIHINYTLERPSDVKINLYNVLGQRIFTLSRGKISEGEKLKIHTKLAKGIYFLNLQTGKQKFQKKIILIR